MLSVDLYNNKDGYFGASNWGWVRLMSLAREFGWKSAGTKPPIGWNLDKVWDSNNYSSNDLQVVTKKDALNLADAIEKAIPLLKAPVENKKETQKFTSIEEAFLARLKMIEDSSQSEIPDPASLGFSLKSKDTLLEFINFCRQGEFFIG